MRHLALFILLALVGIGVGWAISGRPGRAESLEITPRTLKIDGKIPEPDVVEGSLAIENRGRTPLTVIGAVGSCGCMEVAVEASGATGLPLVLGPGEAATTRVKIATANRVGKQRTQVLITYQDGSGERREALANVDFEVQAGWRPSTQEIVAADMEEGETRTEFVSIYDAFPGEGLALGGLRSSRPDLVKAEVVQEGVGSDSPATLVYDANAEPLGRRFTVKLVLEAPTDAKQASAHVFLEPSDPNRLSLVIPVILQRKPPDLAVEPSQVAVPLGAGSGKKRFTILCRADRVPVEEVEATVLRSDLVEIHAGAKLDDHEKLFELTVLQPDAPGAPEGLVEFKAGNDRATVRVEFVGGALLSATATPAAPASAPSP